MSTLPAAIGDLVRELVVNDGLTPEEAARRAVSDALREELEALALPVLTWRARQVLSASHRTAAGRNRDYQREIVGRVTVVDEVRGMLRETFQLPDGTRVQWGEATAAQHRERGELLLRYAERAVEEGTRHNAVAEVLEKARARCLDELPSLYAQLNGNGQREIEAGET